MMNTCDIREYFDNILLGNPEEIIDNLSIIEDHFSMLLILRMKIMKITFMA